MDPLTVFMASLFGSMIAQALRSRAELRDYYPKSAAGELQPYRGWTEMVGGGVRWQVEPGSAVWIDSRYLRPISGNIFDEHKLGAVGKAVKQARRKELPTIAMMAGYGQVHRLDPEWIAESQAYRDDNIGDPFTTGDRQLDEWLVRRYNQENDDEEENQEMEELLAEAVASSQGDLGKWTATVRDGNHRTFGAVLGGEERVAVRLYDNDEQELRELCKKGFGDRRSLERRDLLRKAISDTGKLPHWLDEETAERLQLLPGMETGPRKLLPAWIPHLEEKSGKVYVTVEGLGRILEVLDRGRGPLKPINKGLDHNLFPDDGGQTFRSLHSKALASSQLRFLDSSDKPADEYTEQDVELAISKAGPDQSAVEAIIAALLVRGVPPHVIFLGKFIVRYRHLMSPTIFDLLPERWQQAVDSAMAEYARHDDGLNQVEVLRRSFEEWGIYIPSPP